MPKKRSGCIIAVSGDELPECFFVSGINKHNSFTILMACLTDWNSNRLEYVCWAFNPLEIGGFQSSVFLQKGFFSYLLLHWLLPLRLIMRQSRG